MMNTLLLVPFYLQNDMKSSHNRLDEMLKNYSEFKDRIMVADVALDLQMLSRDVPILWNYFSRATHGIIWCTSIHTL